MVPDAEKPLVWLGGEIKTPPLASAPRIEAGFLLRQLQQGKTLAMPHSRPMPGIGARCHELRIVDRNRTWRIVYRVDNDAIIVLEVFAKTTQATPKHVSKSASDASASMRPPREEEGDGT